MVLPANETVSCFADFAGIYFPGKLLDCFKCFIFDFYHYHT